jgi:alpha-tubulin suppressor-like RCC1 family protein
VNGGSPISIQGSSSLWQIQDVPLTPGLNQITVTAEDSEGNTSTDSVSVNYLQTYFLELTSNPPEGGSVFGSGGFVEGSTAAVQASEANRYTFTGWYENSTLLSEQAEFSLTMSENRSLEARFDWQNEVPNRPINQSPANAASFTTHTPVLSADSYSDPDSDPHHSSQWQVSATSSFSSLVWDASITSGNKSQATIPAGKLSANQTYYWRVRYFDFANSSSEWSSPTSFFVEALSVSINPTATEVSDIAGTYSIAVTSNTSWSVSGLDEEWFTANPTSGTGDGTVTITYETNLATSERIGSFTIGGQSHTVTQAAAPAVTTIDLPSKNVGSASNSYSIEVTSNTSWTVSGLAGWLSASPTGGTSNATVIISYNENVATSERSDSFTIGGQSHTVTQATAPAITTIDLPSKNVGSASNSYSIEVTSNTAWTVSSLAGWLSATPTSGEGDVTVTISYEENLTTSQRSDSFTIGGQSHTITQAAAPAVTTIDPTTKNVDSAASSYTIDVTSNSSWSVSGLAGWLTASHMSGTGNATVTITYDENLATSERSDSFTIGGESHTVTQAAAPEVTTIDPTSKNVGSASSSYTIAVTSNTSWSLSGLAGWLSASPMSGTGDATLTINYNENSATSERSDSFTIGGQSHTVTQAAAPAVTTINPASKNAGSTASSYTIAITSNTSWSVSGLAGWLSASPMSGTGNATVTINYDENLATSERGDSFTIGGQSHTIAQAATANFSIISGYDHSLFTKTDGTFWGMGSNSHGQLGDGTGFSRFLPVIIDSNVVTADASWKSSFYIKSDETLWAMGQNTYGKLGDGTTENRNSPVLIDSSVVKVAASNIFTLYIKSDGSLWAMGRNAPYINNSTNPLGNPSLVDSSTPIQIDDNVVSVAAGGGHALYIKSDGQLYSLGSGYFGQLGNESNANSPTPIEVDSNVISVVAEENHSLYIKSDGTLWAMGSNRYGQLAGAEISRVSPFDTTIVSRPSPQQIASDVESVATCERHTVYIKTDGSVWTMGDNSYGQLGAEGLSETITPLQLTDGSVLVSAGFGYSHFVKVNGDLWSIGHNNNGQLGDGTQIQRDSPVLVANLIAVAGASPTDIALDNQSVLEGLPVETVVGLLSSVDSDASDEFSYALVNGNGASGNEKFSIQGNSLLTAEILDYNVAQNHSIRVRTTDSTGRYLEGIFNVEVGGLFELTYDYGPGGQIVGDNSQTVLENGSGQPVAAEPDLGAVFREWSDGSAVNPRQDENVTSDINVTAYFDSTSGTPLEWFGEHGLQPAEGQAWDAFELIDTDGDGWSNKYEFLIGTAPNNAADHFKVTEIDLGPPVQVHFSPSKGGLSYTLLYTNDLGSDWLPVAGQDSVAFSDAATPILSDSLELTDHRFYKVKIEGLGDDAPNFGNEYRYSFDETLGEESALLAAATTNSTPSYTDGVSGKALYFNRNAYGRLPAIDFSQFEEFTLSIWVKEIAMYSDGTAYVIWGAHDQAGPLVANFQSSISAAPADVAIPDSSSYVNRWVHFAVVYRDNDVRFYVDGELVDSSTTQLTPDVNYTGYIGSHYHTRYSSYYDRFEGAIDELRIIHRALSSEEVTNLHDSYSFSQ